MKNRLTISLFAAFALIALSMLAPFALRNAPDAEFSAQYSGYTMLRSDDAVLLGEEDVRGDLIAEDGSAMPDLSYLYAILLAAAVVGASGCLLDRSGNTRLGMGLVAGLAGTAVGIAIIALSNGNYALPRSGFEDLVFTQSVGWGAYAVTALSAIAVALSAMGLVKRDRQAVRPQQTTWLIARVGVLGAIAAVLFLIPGIPLILPFYKLDFSTVPVLLGGFSMGVWPALGILLIKDLFGLLTSSSGGVGELADFLASAAFVIPAALIYRRRHNLRGALLGMLVGIVGIVVAGVLSNYYILIPAFFKGVPQDVIVSEMSKLMPAIDSMWKMMLIATAPFNLIKGVALSLVTIALYKRLSPLLKSR